MNLFGYELSLRRKALPSVAPPVGLANVGYTNWFGPFWGPIRESFTGAWQQNVTVAPTQTLLSSSSVYACVTGIASDIAKLRIKLDRNINGIWEEVTVNSPWLPLLRKPNRYQSRIAFVEQWIISKLLYGNAYILKERADARGLVTGLYVLSPALVKTLVAEDGGVYYELDRDALSGIEERVLIPARDIIHDMMPALWHPLIGVAPIYACAMSATMGNTIQTNSTKFFANKSMPGGMLSAPGMISNEVAARLKTSFEANFSGENVGRLFVAGDGVVFTPFTIAAEQSQLVEQLGWAVEDVARAFHYPIDKLGLRNQPYSTGSNTEARTVAYYTDCLQTLIEKLELSLDEGLELPMDLGTEMDLDNLWRMDSLALAEANAKSVGGAIMTPNEARYRMNLPPVTGGDSPYLQQQNYSLEALSKRDSKEDPFAKEAAPTEPAAKPVVEPPQDTTKSLETETIGLIARAASSEVFVHA